MADPTPPQPGLLQAANQAGALWKKQTARRRTVLIVALLAVVGVVAFLYLKPVNTGWTAVLQKAAPEDALELGAALDGKGIPHQFADAGSTIEVPNERIGEARVVAQAAGLPHAGDGFELFDHQAMGQSSFTEQVNYRRALQGELARSITTLVQVDGARVQIALGRRSVLKDADERPSASVALRLRQGTTLTADEVRGIKQLVAASIEGMAPDSVVVIDQHGVALNGDSKGSGKEDNHEVELATSQRVRSMLERVVGVGHVVVVTSADIDTTQVSQTEELFDKDKIALRSESKIQDGSDSASAGALTSGVAGTQGNLNPTPATSTPGGGPGHLSETKNYEVSKVVRQTVGGGDRIHRLHLALLIDARVGADGKVTPRTQPELDQLTALAQQAAGFDEDRKDKIEVREVQFAPEEPAAPEVAAAKVPKAFPIMLVAAGGGALLLIIIITVFVLRRGKDETHAMVLPAPVSELERMLSSSASNAPQLPGPRPVHARVVETVRADVPRAVGVLSGWLSPPAAPTSERS